MFGFTFHTPQSSAEALLPSPLKPLTHGGFGFWHVSFAEYKRVGTGLLGGKASGHVVVYSLYAQIGNTVGLFPVRVDTDMARLRQWSAFACMPCTFSVDDDGFGTVDLLIQDAGPFAQVRLDTRLRPSLPSSSPFKSLSEAAGFLHPPSQYLYVDDNGVVQVSPFERKLASTTTRLISVPISKWGFLAHPEVVPEVAFELKPHTCRWEKEEPLAGSA